MPYLVTIPPRDIERWLMNELEVWSPNQTSSFTVSTNTRVALTSTWRRWMFKSELIPAVGMESQFNSLMCTTESHKSRGPFETSSKWNTCPVTTFTTQSLVPKEAYVHPMYQIYQITLYILSQHRTLIIPGASSLVLVLMVWEIKWSMGSNLLLWFLAGFWIQELSLTRK